MMTKVLIGVAVAFIKEGKILIGKRKNAHGMGTYATPGGYVESHETPLQAAKREALEETNLTIISVKQGPWIFHRYPDFDSLSLFL